MKCNVRVLMLMLLMCWASQSLAQPTRATAIVAQAQIAQHVKNFTIGTCEIIPENMSAEESIGSPVGHAYEFIWNHIYKAELKSEAEQSRIRIILDSMREKATATLIKQAQHANYELDESISTQGFYYEPKEGYVGKDAFSYLVKFGPYTVKVNSYVHVGVANPWGDGDRPDIDRRNMEKICGKRGMMWRVVSLDTDNAGLVTTGDYSQTSSNFSSYAYLPPQVTFRDLTGAAVGETTGEGANATITLDTDAAGYGWYEGGLFSFGDLSLDANFNNSLSPILPQEDTGSRIQYGMAAEGDRGFNDMSNWLPTSNPFEWVARAGTAAEGKMDMLSVLLHEYGHVLDFVGWGFNPTQEMLALSTWVTSEPPLYLLPTRIN